MTAFVRAAALMNFPEVARQFGLDPERLVREAALDPRALADPDLRVPAEQVAAVLETAAVRSACPTVGLRMAESRKLADFGATSLLITHQPTLRAALKTIAQYRHLLNEALVLQIEDSGDLVILREELVIASRVPLRQAHELAVGTVFRTCRALLGGGWSPLGVYFTHAAPSDTSIHRRLFGPRVHFESDFNGIVCVAADLERPNPTADPRLAEYARQFLKTLPHAERGSTTHEVRTAIYLLLPTGRASIVEVAAGLGINLRTLQRQLAAERTEFSALLAEVRRELAERYLASPTRSLTQIAEMLGFGRLSSFTRWFVAEFGEPPSARRKRGSGDAQRVQER
jgi:AraC-like DNA-binding protein